MNQHGDIGAQILSGIFLFFWCLSRPFVWLYKALRWLVIAITKETGNKIAKLVGGMIAIAIVGYIYQLIFNHPLN